MKILKKVLKTSLIILIVLFTVVLIFLIFVNRMTHSGLPDYEQSVILPGIEQSVTVYRDSLAVPHIYASNENDLYQAVGYLMAQDRMWQMDLLRRVTLGRLSEIFGEDFIKTDLLLRSLRFTEKSEHILETTEPEVAAAMEAFADGVNAYIKDYENNYPLEFKILGYTPDLWEPKHSVNLIGYMAWDLKAGWSELVLTEIAEIVDSLHFAELLPTSVNQKHLVFKGQSELAAQNSLLQLENLETMGLDIFSGSNNWAVSGTKTTTGLPLLANDMHISFGIPGIWIQMHQVVEGGLNVSGLVLPGQPFVIVGHNDSIAWGMTNTYVDNLDLYQEKINPVNTNKYEYNGVWNHFEIKDERIRCKGGAEHTMIYRFNHRGPVVSGFKGIEDKVLTMHWVGDENSDEIQAVYKLNRAANWNEFRDAFRTFRSISQNVVYADVKGNIGLHCCAGIPIRKRDKVYGILPGWTDEYDWQGMVPFDELPYEYNPERGYVSSANNRTIDASYPYHIGTWFDVGYRIDRIRELLEEQDSYSVQDFKTIQTDFQSSFSKLFLETLLPVLKPDKNWEPIEREAFEILNSWDYNLQTTSIAASISEVWSFNFMATVFGDEMGDEVFEKYIKVSHLPRYAMHSLLVNSRSGWLDDTETAETEQLEDIALRSFKETIIELRARFGDDVNSWKWGAMHQFTLNHPLAKVKVLDKVFKLNRGAYSVGGSYHTVAPYKYILFDPGNIVHGASHRNIFNIGNWDASESVIPTGTSGVPSSDFYCSQTEAYVNGLYYTECYSEEKVKENSLFQMEFTP